MTTATVTNIVVLPDGTTPTTIAVRIQLVGSTGSPLTSAYVTATGVLVDGLIEINSTTGAWSAVLQLNSGTNLTPSGTQYQVTQIVYNSAGHSLTYVDNISVAGSGTMASMLTTAPASLPPAGALAPGDQIVDVARQYGGNLGAAITARGNSVDYLLTPGVYTVSSTVDLPTDGQVIGAGSGAVTINVVGAITGLRYRPQNVTSRAKLSGVTIAGVGSGGTGLQVSDCFGFKMHDVVIKDCGNIGLLFYNVSMWTEGTEMIGVHIKNCATGWQLTRSNATGGTSSFGYTRCLSAAINVPAGGVGVLTNGDAPIYWYNSIINLNMWVGTNGTAFRTTNPSDNITGNTVHWVGEKETGATGTVAFDTAASPFIVEGYCSMNLDSLKTGVGNVRVMTPAPVDTQSGVNAGVTYKSIFATDLGVAYTGQVGYRTANNLSDVYVGIYNGTGNKFTVRCIDFGSDPSVAPEIFAVLQTGEVVLASGAAVRSGAGSPNTVVVGNPGDLYLNTGGGAGATLWVKESGAGTNTGWVGK